MQPAKIIERLYAPLLKHLNLAPEQKEKFYQVLLDYQTSAAALRTDLLRHEDISRLATAAADLQKETDAKLLVVLGDAHFAEYQKFKAELVDRQALEIMTGDFSKCPLTEEQQQRLLETMVAARKAAGSPVGGDKGFSIADSSEVLERKLNREKSIHDHVRREVAGFLSLVQLQALETALARRITFAKKGWEKTQEMFGGRR